MLQLLKIDHVAVVERAEITFGPGFNVLTGETGAGKSIVIDAMGAVLGGRVSRDLVRTGAENATVTAVFTDVPVLDWFEENGVDPEDELYLLRKITAEGKSSARVNGIPVSAGQLRALGELLLNIHGQHDGQQLLDEVYHLGYLDRFGDVEAPRTAYRSAYNAHRALQAEYNALQMDESEKARRLDTLQFQIQELEEANLRPGEEEALQERRTLLANAGKLAARVNDAFAALYGDDDGSVGAISLVGQADDQVEYAAELSESFKPIAAGLKEARYGLEDAVEQLRDLRDSLEFSPEELDELEARLALLNRLGRKYGGSETEMLAFLERCKEELDTLSFSADRAAKLEKQLAETEQAVITAGQALRAARQKAAKELETRIIKELGELSMPGVRFAVDFAEQAPDATGLDAVSFVMSANAGEKLGKISRIASGGELARIMLALKSVLAENDTVSTMVFDEVDTGVSGIAAQRVGEKMCSLAHAKQVICVTHLPQIAALADGHFLINKQVADGRTYTQVTLLDMDGRKQEIARLTGGDRITDVTLLSAGEQIAAAEAYKTTRE
ncbi:MAG: DNA repair protein RecN [Oscillospiraceae bacterium]|nr:DNA repair protein RecN [Oscillospiraceae bacterium]